MGTVISPSRPQAENISEHDEEPLYHVVLLDDSEHTYDYVIEMLTKLFCMSETQAFQHAVEVDTNGRTIVLTCDLPAAEYAKAQILGYGADWRMPQSKGSMSAILEPVPKS
ncbi:MAG TPA: ATP-dependent Clp protease adaptor ClpS [Bryobacteraceae bacterium]|jgi:ATP-dependent Clp protease adaptor protein ClpS|nr:ATP-dependent Clp protease adaptor ClpS [Bryobacteraceae bacterium]